MNNKALAAIALTIIIAAPIGIGYLLNVDEVEDTSFEVWGFGSANVTDLINNSTTDIYTPYTGVQNNQYMVSHGDYVDLDFITTSSNNSPVPILSQKSTFVWSLDPGYNNITSNFGDTWYISAPNHTICSFTYTNNGVSTNYTTSANYDGTIFKQTLDYFFIGSSSQSYPIKDISNIRFNLDYTDNISSLTVVKTGISGYADPADGWHSGTTVYDRWLNNYDNKDVTLTINLAQPSPTNIYYNGTGTGVFVYVQKTNTGLVNIETHYRTDYDDTLIDSVQLGDYQYIQMNLALDKVTVSGLSSWPAMSKRPQLYNTTELDIYIPNNLTAIRGLVFQPLSLTNPNIYRVDAATILSGSYPTAEDAEFNIREYYGQARNNYELKISKIGIYGDSITFAGHTMDVKDDKLELPGGSKIELDNAVFKSITYDGTTWQNFINNKRIDTTNQISNVVFNGLWSAAYTASVLVEETSVNTEWIPGGFGIDTEWFGIIGLGVCAAAVIGLGMYGRKSGTKMLWLAMVAGGAGLVFFMLI